jgi:5S rRNA maturation endonuclease (ribonuclease M5)
MNKIKNYLNNRCISDEVIESSKIRFENGKIVIPVMDKNKMVLFNKYRKDPENNDKNIPKYTYDSGSHATLFNTHTLVDKNKSVFCVEGEGDALCLTSAGLQAVSGTGGSGTFKEEWAEMLEEYDVYICYDRDLAGIKGTLKVNRLLPKAKIICLPEFDGKDVTDFVVKYGVSKFLELPSMSWSIPEPNIDGSKTKQIKGYNDIANKGLEYQRANPQLTIYTEQIINTALEYRDRLKKAS